MRIVLEGSAVGHIGVARGICLEAAFMSSRMFAASDESPCNYVALISQV